MDHASVWQFRRISVDLRGALVRPKVNHRAAITEPGELGALLRAIEGYNGQLTTRLALQLSALLFVHPGELRQARWKEIDFDKAVWVVPSSTMKMKRPHRVPLSRQAIVILRELHGVTGKSEFVFPAVDSFRRCMSNNTMNAALRRLGYSRKEVSVSVSGPRLQPYSTRWVVGIRMQSSGNWRTWKRMTSAGLTCTLQSFGTSASR
jgi:integrase